MGGRNKGRPGIQRKLTVLNKVDGEDSTEKVTFESRTVAGEISGEEQTRQKEQ